MLANLDDVKARIPHVDFDEDQALGLLEEASALVEGYLQKPVPEPVPESIKIVVSRMVARVIEAPKETVFQESMQVTAGPFSQSANFTHGGSGGAPWLTASDKTMLGPFRKKRRGIYSITMS